MMSYRYYILLNVNSGSVEASGITGEALAAALAARSIDAVVDADPDTPLSERIEKAVASDADVVVAAGGDGTVTAVAGAVCGTGKRLGILPLGTANMLARDLGIPLEIDGWLDSLIAMEPRPVDLGRVNGRLFLHKVVIGVLPALAAGREYIRGEGGGAVLGFLRYLARRLARTRRIAVAVSVNGGPPHVERVQTLAVASNAYDEGVGMFFSRSRLDTGTLTIYRLKHLTLGDMLRLTLLMFVGHWRDDEALTIEEVRTVTIVSKKPALKVMFDGEVEMMPTPLEFDLLPCGLEILAPPRQPAANAQPLQASTAV